MLEHSDHISLLFEISGCPKHCIGCHSPELQLDIGEELTPIVFIDTIKRYQGLFDCIIFFGGDQYPDELIRLLRISKIFNLKTCLWTGTETIDLIDKEIIKRLDYIKVGSYQLDKGPLRSETSNQKYYNLSTGELIKL